jgi:hypothetical protein
MHEAKEIFPTTTYSIYELLTRKDLGLIIPTYQRAYSWRKEHVFDLLDDAVSGIDEMIRDDSSNTFSFIGTIITTDGTDVARATGSSLIPSQVLEIVDGQQRISTINIICLAMLVNLIEKLDKVQRLLTENNAGLQNLNLVHQIYNHITGSLELVIAGEQHSWTDTTRFIRLIRADYDKWLPGNTSVTSPLAFLVHRYLNSKKNRQRFTPASPLGHEGTNHEKQRYLEVSSLINDFYIQLDDSTAEDSMNVLLNIPSLESMLKSKNAVNRLLPNLPLPVGTVHSDDVIDEEVKNSIRLCCFASYFLNHVAFTEVRGADENFALEVFQSLNTSGEPLNAYETFKPSVIRAIDQRNYPGTPEADLFKQIDKTLSKPNSQERKRRLVQEAIITFALAQSGKRVGNNLGLQAKFFRDSFRKKDLHENPPLRQAYLKLFSSTCEVSHIFLDSNKSLQNHSKLITCVANDQQAKTCFRFLADIRHSVVLPILVRFYDVYDTEDSRLSSSDIKGVIKALTAFSVLWRTAFSGTNGIDSIYRKIAEDYANKKDDEINLDHLKETLKSVLQVKQTRKGGPLKNKRAWVDLAKRSPVYEQDRLCKFLLLLIHNDTVADSSFPGLVTKGVRQSNECFTFENFMEPELETEHIAPQSPAAVGDWSVEFESNPKLRNHIGNLVLIPKLANIGLGNRAWSQKRKIFAALANNDLDARDRALTQAGFRLTDRIKEILNDSVHVQAASSLAMKEGNWDEAFVEARSERLMELAYEKLITWLN